MHEMITRGGPTRSTRGYFWAFPAIDLAPRFLSAQAILHKQVEDANIFFHDIFLSAFDFFFFITQDSRPPKSIKMPEHFSRRMMQQCTCMRI